LANELDISVQHSIKDLIKYVKSLSKVTNIIMRHNLKTTISHPYFVTFVVYMYGCTKLQVKHEFNVIFAIFKRMFFTKESKYFYTRYTNWYFSVVCTLCTLAITMRSCEIFQPMFRFCLLLPRTKKKKIRKLLTVKFPRSGLFKMWLNFVHTIFTWFPFQ
jgi:hypothetical protein